MGTGANRILKVMQKSGKNTISSAVFLTVNSLNPLTFKLDDRLVITKEFYILSDDIILSRLAVGIKLLAFTFNDGQCYFIHQTVDNNIIKTKIIDNLTDDSIIDSLSARQGKLLGIRVKTLEDEVVGAKRRITNLENRMSTAENNINALENKTTKLEDKIDDLESRVTSLESQ